RLDGAGVRCSPDGGWLETARAPRKPGAPKRRRRSGRSRSAISRFARSWESPRTRFDLDQVFPTIFLRCPGARSAMGLCRSRTPAMLIFCNTPNESQLNAARPNCDNVILLQNFLDGPAEWFCLVRDARSMTTMNWFRTRARLGACLALFALAFQLA